VRGAFTVAIAARDRSRASAVASLAESAIVVEWDETEAAVVDADLVVNATPVGMAGEELLPEALFRREQTVVDLVYWPPATPFLDRARAAGATALGGLGMLVHQAAASFRIWTGQEPPLEAMSAAAIRELGRRDTETDISVVGHFRHLE